MQVLLIYCFLTVSTRPAASKQLFRLKKSKLFFTQGFQLSGHHAVKLVLHKKTMEIFLNNPSGFFQSVLQLLRFKVSLTCICINQNIPFNENNKRTPLSVVQMVKTKPGKTQIRSKLHGLSEFLS